MGVVFGYILLFISTMTTIIAIALHSTYAIKGILSIVFASSCILRYKSENRTLAVNLAFWISSIIIVFSLILEQFLK